MAQAQVIRLPNGDLRPAGEQSRHAFSRFEIGEVFPVEVKKTRNIKNHRRFFALIQVVSSYSEIFNTEEKALHAVKIAAGHCDFVPHPLEPGELMAIPKSISFAKMDEIEFQRFFSSAVQGVLSHILPQMDERSMEAALNEVVSF